MLTIKHLDHVVLRVVDLQAMLNFYTGVLRCPVEKVQEDLGLYQLRAGAALIDLVPVDGPLGRKGGAAPGGGIRKRPGWRNESPASSRSRRYVGTGSSA